MFSLATYDFVRIRYKQSKCRITCAKLAQPQVLKCGIPDEVIAHLTEYSATSGLSIYS
jgi:hypothetical protein